MSEAPTIASLGIKVDTTEAADGSVDLDKLTASAKGAQKAAEESSGGFKTAGEAIGEFAAHARRETLALFDASAGVRAFTGILAHLPLPLLLGAGAIAVLAKAYTDGKDQIEGFSRAVATSGDASGATASQLHTLADEIGKVHGNTSLAAQAVTALAATGSIGKDNLKQFATAAVDANETVGTSFQDIAKQFAALANDPLGASEALNKQIGQLTPQLRQQIIDLQQSGQFAKAGAVAQGAYSDALEKQAQQLDKTSHHWSDFWSAVVSGAGRAAAAFGLGKGGQSDEEKLAALVQARQARGNRALGQILPGGDTTQQLIDDRTEARLRAQIAAQNAQAQATSAQTRANQENVRSQALVDAQLQDSIAIQKATESAQSQRLQQQYQSQAAQIQSQQDILEAQHSAGLLSDESYYAARAKLIQDASRNEIAALDAEAASIRNNTAKNAGLYAQLAKAAPTDVAREKIITQQKLEEVSATAQLNAIETRRAQVSAETSNKVRANTIQEQGAIEQLNRSYVDLQVSAQRYNATLSQQYAATLSGAGQGQAFRDQQSALQDIRNHYQQQQQQLDDQLRNKQIEQPQFDRESQALKDALAQAEGDYTAYYSNLNKQQSSWQLGAQEAYHNYADAAKNVANLSEQAFTDSFKSMEDSIVNFATTGKFSFKDLATSILGDLIRVEVKILESQALSSIFNSFGYSAYGRAPAGGAGLGDFGGGAGGVAYAATGGPISGPTIVGETGPELFVPDQPGTVVPNGMWQGAGPTINITNHIAPGMPVAEIQARIENGVQRAVGTVYNDIYRGRFKTALRKGS